MAISSAPVVASEIRHRLPGVPIKKLHKLLYYCQAHHAATFNRPLFSETISAWDMRPVVGQLWWSEKQHGQTGATEPALGEAELNTIGYVLSRYGRLSGAGLERLTHNEAPWIDAPAAEDEIAEVPLDRAEIDEWLKGVGDRARTEFSFDSVDSLTARRR